MTLFYLRRRGGHVRTGCTCLFLEFRSS